MADTTNDKDLGTKGKSEGHTNKDKDKGFQPEAFYEAIAATVAARQLSWKQVSKETMVGTSTLTRMAQGRQPDAASLAALSAWAGINPAEFVKRPGGAITTAEPLSAALTLLRADPKLKPEDAKALEAIIKAAYNQFRRDPEE